MKLLSMTDYILHIDGMTTKEFCDAYGIPHPTIEEGVTGFLTIDAIKHRFFLEYAKFLKQKIRVSMFVGDRAVFPNFESGVTFEDEPVIRMKGSKQVYAYLNGNPQMTDVIRMNFPRSGERVEDLIGYIEECNYKEK